MKYQTRFVTETGSTYVWSYMSETLWKIGRGGEREFVLRSGEGPTTITVGRSVHVDGERFHPGKGEPRPYHITTSRVVSIEHEPDFIYQGTLAGTS